MRKPADMVRDLGGLARRAALNHQEQLLVREAAEMIRSLAARAEGQIAEQGQIAMDAQRFGVPSAPMGGVDDPFWDDDWPIGRDDK